MGEPLEGALAAERTIIANAKKAGLMVSGVAMQKYMMGLQDQQEIMGAMANMIIEVYAMESAVLRTQKLIASKGEASCETPIAMTRAYISGSIDKVESEAKRVLAGCAEGDTLRTQMAILRRLFKYEPLNSIAARQHVADRVIEAGKYIF
jgi:hypothetical protein